MHSLPISIEDNLKEVGFNPTEILVLRHLLTGNHFTLRELAAKTGKSTGLLDQGMKKLLQRGFVRTIQVNTSVKYTLHSVSALSSHIRQYFVDHVITIKRKSDDVSAFFTTLQLEHSRPAIQYFDGPTGIASMFEHLQHNLTPHQEVLCYMVVLPDNEMKYSKHTEEYSQLRRKYNVSLKVLTHATVDSKRYRSKDVFHLRETRFITPNQCPLSIEHILTEQGYYCIDYKKNVAQVITHDTLLQEMRSVFMTLWNIAE
jgi:DNA-binding MarR family transcriptional regulator